MFAKSIMCGISGTRTRHITEKSKNTQCAIVNEHVMVSIKLHGVQSTCLNAMLTDEVFETFYFAYFMHKTSLRGNT